MKRSAFFGGFREGMKLDENKVIPMDAILMGERVDFRKIVENARLNPWHFLCELATVGLVVTGAITVVGWAYELGKIVGRL